MAALSALVDHFSGTVVNTNLWTPFTAGGATLAYSGAGVTVSYPVSSTASTDGDLSSVASYDLTSSYAFLQVTGVPSAATHADAELRVYIDANNYFRWVYEAGTLYAQYMKASSRTTVTSFTYNSATHRYWRIRESGGVCYFETSSDGLTFTSHGSFLHGMTITSVSVRIAATCFQNETNPGVFSWSNFNGAGATVLPITYKYDVYRNGVYLGVLPNVTSPFTYTQDINTPGSQLVITIAQDIDTQQQPVTLLTDESGDQLTDEGGNPFTTDRTPDIYGNLNQSAMIRNGNEIKVWEYTTWQPNGVLVFDGVVSRWNPHIGVDDSVDLTVLSYGSELNNNILYGDLTVDQFATTPNTTFNGPTSAVFGVSPFAVAQIIITGPTITNISGVSFMAAGIQTLPSVTLKLYSYTSGNPDSGSLLGNVTFALVNNESIMVPPLVTATFASPITVSPNTTYALVWVVNSGDGYWLYSTDTYAGGPSWVYTSSTWTSSTTPFMFLTFAANAQGLFTNSVYFSEDPSAMVSNFVGNYITSGGHVGIGNITSSSAIGTYPFILNTVLEGITACLSIAPSGYYWYVDVGSNLLYFQPKSATPDHLFTFKVHITTFELLVVTESIINAAYLTAGNTTSGQPILAYAADQASITNFGLHLDRPTDSRIIDAPTAQVVVNNYVETNAIEQYQSQITIFSSNYDLTTLHVGQITGFNGFESYADTIQMQIVRVTRFPDYAMLDLGTVPIRASTKAEKIERSLLATQTVNNPLNAI